MAKTYDENSIKRKEFPDNVRKKVGMYLGTNEQKGFFHTFVEILDNSLDEFNAGYGDKIIINVDTSTNIIGIKDFGRGIPFGINQYGVSALVDAMTILHSGGKHDNEDEATQSEYSFSNGINGVGASVVNAVSDFFYVESIRDKEKATFKCEHGRVAQDIEITKNKNKEPNGTFIQWKPSIKANEFDKANVFAPTCNFVKEDIIEKLKYIPYIFVGLELELNIDNEQIIFKKENQFSDILNVDNANLLFKDNLSFKDKYIFVLDKKNNDKKVLLKTEFEALSSLEIKKYFHKEIEIDFAFNFAIEPNPNQIYFANGIKISGGKIKTTLKNNFKNIVNKYLVEQNKKLSFEADDILSNCSFGVIMRLNDLQLAGQTKDELDNPEVVEVLNVFLKKYITFWINRIDKKNVDNLLKILEAAKKAREYTQSVTENVFKSIKNLKDTELLSFKGKLEDCSSNNADLNELYIVEGDSASGGIRLSRSSKYQAFIPLKGKPLNVIKPKNKEKIFTNEEIKSLAYALGGIGKDFDIEKLKYKKIIILADADLDGFHIAALMLTFFYQFYPELIHKGYIYVALAPLYKISFNNGSTIEWAWNHIELAKKTENKRGYVVTRNKGLGEMNPVDLFETTLNPKNRLFVQIHMKNKQFDDDKINIYMSDAKNGKDTLKEIFEKYYAEKNTPIISLTKPLEVA